MGDSNIPSSAPVEFRLSRGITPRLRLSPSVDGKGIDSRIELHLDTCIYWLEIALDHLSCAKNAHEELIGAKTNGDNFISILDREFKASMQASVAAATFFEALHAVTIERNPSKPVPYDPNKCQPRRARVTEQLRKSFCLGNKGAKNLSSVLREIYRFRREAVHPSGIFSEPVLHPQLQVGVEKRFVMFRYENALQLVRAALAFSKILPSQNLQRQPKAMQEFASYLLQVSSPLYAAWEEKYGSLLDEPPPPAQPNISKNKHTKAA